MKHNIVKFALYLSFLAFYIAIYLIAYSRGKERGYTDGYVDALSYATRLALEAAAPKQSTNYIIVPINTNHIPQ